MPFTCPIMSRKWSLAIGLTPIIPPTLITGATPAISAPASSQQASLSARLMGSGDGRLADIGAAADTGAATVSTGAAGPSMSTVARVSNIGGTILHIGKARDITTLTCSRGLAMPIGPARTGRALEPRPIDRAQEILANAPIAQAPTVPRRIGAAPTVRPAPAE